MNEGMDARINMNQIVAIFPHLNGKYRKTRTLLSKDKIIDEDERDMDM